MKIVWLSGDRLLCKTPIEVGTNRTGYRAVGARHNIRNASANALMDKLRIDKWLWAARFYKTRTLAGDEIDKGRVLVNDSTVKAAREVKPGDTVRLRQGSVTRTVTVLAVSAQRGPAPMAALLYRETEDSIQQRQQAAEQRRLAPEPALALTQGRPTKRDRRHADQLRQDPWNDRWSACVDD